MPNAWDDEIGALVSGTAFCSFNLLRLLIEKGLIEQHEAAAVMTKTATQVREGSEDGGAPQNGENAARRFEAMAGWLLGYNPKP